ncbi:MAG: hypothetical protein HZB50_06490 [Chloroflexi bacterium]|nr:hypothetical protein [Chloroflexota bacterium]
MQIPCIVTVKKRSLLSHILTDLTGTSGDGLFLIYSAATSMEEFVVEIENSDAAVVMLEKSGIFAEEDAVAKLLTVFSKLLVIVISEDNNWLNIFRREDKLLVSSVDLIDAVSSRLDNSTQNK